MNTSVRIAVAIVAFIPLLTSVVLADWSNLKVLPSDISEEDLNATMERMQGEVGLTCEQCHSGSDRAVDTEKKKIARSMIRMTVELNRDWFVGNTRVSCYTCHRGKPAPVHAPPVPSPPEDGPPPPPSPEPAPSPKPSPSP